MKLEILIALIVFTLVLYSSVFLSGSYALTGEREGNHPTGTCPPLIPKPELPPSGIVHFQGTPSSTLDDFSTAMCAQIGGCYSQISESLSTIEKCSEAGVNCNQPWASTSRCGKADLAMNVYLNPSLSSNNQVLQDGDSVCAGQPLKINSVALTGEWFGKGGPIGSPLISFVSEDQLRNIILKANQKRSQVVISGTPSWSAVAGHTLEGPETLPADPDVAPGITLYRSSLYAFRSVAFMYTYGNVICSTGGSMSSPSGQLVGDALIPTQIGQTSLDVNYAMKCIFYVERFITKDYNQPAYDVLVLDYAQDSSQQPSLTATSGNFMSAFSIKPIDSTIKLNVVDSQSGPNLQLATSSSNDVVKVTVTNNGDAGAILSGLSANTLGTQLSVQNKLPIKLDPGQSADLFVPANQVASNAKFSPVYTSTGPSCSSQAVTSTTSTQTSRSGSCSDNSQCSTNLCCEGLCRDPTQGACRDLLGNGVLKWVPFQ